MAVILINTKVPSKYIPLKNDVISLGRFLLPDIINAHITALTAGGGIRMFQKGLAAAVHKLL